MRRHISVPAALLLTGTCAAALVFGMTIYSGQPNYFTSAARVLIGANHDEATGAEIREILSGAAPQPLGQPILAKELQQVYETREQRPIWTGSPVASAQAETALGVLRASWEHGLDPAAYHLDKMPARRPKTVEEAAQYDVLLTDGVLRYLRDMRSGRASARAADKDVLVPGGFDAEIALADAVNAGTVADLLEESVPAQPEYARLKTALAHYREIASSGGFPDIAATTRIVRDPANRPMLKLRQRLALEDKNLSATRDANNNDVVAALKRYQARNGLAADGVLTRETIRMLNVPASQRAAQIAANMERWRWLPERFEPTRIMVNVTTAMLDAYKDGKTALTSRVVVGSPSTPTPILVSTARALLVNPPWNVPTSIIRNEILPKLRANPYYLETQRMRVVGQPTNASWTTGNGLRIQQEPGRGSALGVLKFEMPNEFDVYLHDTPTKATFTRDMRAVSHGCVRVHQILALGSFALTGDAKAGLNRINKLVGGKTATLGLPQPLPVYILYWTAVPEESGAIGFKTDVYGRDRRLIAAMGALSMSALPPATSKNPS